MDATLICILKAACLNPQSGSEFYSGLSESFKGSFGIYLNRLLSESYYQHSLMLHTLHTPRNGMQSIISKFDFRGN
jgi:hypothetical protein